MITNGRPRCATVLAVALILLNILAIVVGQVFYSMSSKYNGSITSPDVVLLQGNAGTSTIYSGNTSARASFQGPNYYPGTINIITGTYISGTTGSLQTVDSDRYVVRSQQTGPTENVAFNPSSYNLLGTTTLVSGSTSNLASNDGSYMTFNSYASAFETSSATQATIAYQTGSPNTLPGEKIWNGTSWSSETSLPDSGDNIQWVRVAYSTSGARYQEKVAVTLGADNNLDAYVWNGTVWSITSNIASVGTCCRNYRSFDIVYEKTQGRALLVYSNGGTSNDMSYRIWNGTAWSSASNLDLAGTGTNTRIFWIAMAQKPISESNEIALAAMDGNFTDVYGLIWNGSSWGNEQQLDTDGAIATEESLAVAYEQVSGKATFVWGISTNRDMRSRQWNGTAWGSTLTFDGTNSATSTPNWVTLAADPASNRLMLSVVDGDSDLNTSDWNGTAWAVHTEHDAAVNSHAMRTGTVEFEPTGSEALLVWVTDTTNISYKTWTPGAGWSSTSTFDYPGADGRWIQARRDPRNVGSARIMVATADLNNDLLVDRWNGTAFFTGVNATGTLQNTSFERFDLRLKVLSDPTEFTAEVEFSALSNTNVWTSILWSVDSAWDTGSVTVTLQLYNYTAAAYPSSGNGYIAYTSSSTANTDENKNQTISSNPSHFRDGSGTWKAKIKGIKTTTSQFKLKVDWIEYRVTQYNEFKVETEFVFSGITSQTTTKLNFTTVIQWNIASVSVTIQLWNYTSSAWVTSGPGYLTYTSSATASTDESKTLTITSNFSTYVSAGGAKMKVTGLKSTATQYQQGSDLDRLIYKLKYDYVLRVKNNSGSQAWNVRLSQFASTSLARLNNLTVWFHDGSTSNQITVIGGSFTLSTGPFYSLGTSTTIYIAAEIEAASTQTSTVDTYLEIFFPSTTVYARYTITFEIT